MKLGKVSFRLGKKLTRTLYVETYNWGVKVLCEDKTDWVRNKSYKDRNFYNQEGIRDTKDNIERGMKYFKADASLINKIINTYTIEQEAATEEWKPITFAKRYEVSNLGRIRNKKTKRVLAYCGGKNKNHNQYTVFLNCNSFWGREQHSVSQIVYNHWCLAEGEKPSYYEHNSFMVKGNRIGHKDGNKANNRANNLYRY
jgi:hypothetical protein